MFCHLVVAQVAAPGPNWAEKLSAIGSILSGATLLFGVAGVWFAVRQLAEARTDRHVQIIAELGRRWDEDRMIEARNKLLAYDNAKLAEKCADWVRTRSDAEVTELLRVPNYFEDLAMMVECGKLELDLVADTFGDMTLRAWDHWALAIQELSERQPDCYDRFAGLAGRLRRRDEPTSFRRRLSAARAGFSQPG